MNYSDPSHVFDLNELRTLATPHIPQGFSQFWQQCYADAMMVKPDPILSRSIIYHSDFEVFDINYTSTDQFMIGGWLLVPRKLPVTQGMVVGHGYGGREAPDFDLPLQQAAYLFPCFRGLSRSRKPPISDNPAFHVLDHINVAERYIIRGCVEDLWLAVSTLEELFPQTKGHIGYMGTSFGGGIGALALPWEERIQIAHFNVPTFGNQKIRLELPTYGSGAAVQQYYNGHPEVMPTLELYDAAVAAQFVRKPVHVAAALSDAVVTPPGQFSVYNALTGSKSLYVLDYGHAEYPRQAYQEKELLQGLTNFFHEL